jgi:carbamoyl-phosphate synthase large subunit
MPRRDDLQTILLLGSGPIVIGQACEFDYSGTQACKVLRREGYRVVLVNSNPATIMTDPEFADATYVEPLTPEFVAKVIAKEHPDALLPTLGGQTGLNVAVALAEMGVLDEYGVELIGASVEVIRMAEDRSAFSRAIREIGLDIAASGRATSVDDAHAIAERLGFPLLVRPSFTLGGAGSGLAHDEATLTLLVTEGLGASPIHEVQLDESLLGWKEFELEVMRDAKDNCVVICAIENLDPMGVHTGDSITIAPAQTLSDVEFQMMRDAAFAVMRKVGVTTGGSNVQFAVHPQTGRMTVVEMNPRVSRSSALASKATGFPIAKIAALLAVGYTLDEIPNDITRQTLAAFEPSIDYVVVKIPRFAFEKFPGTDIRLGPRMRSVGEVMAIGRTFKEALGKALRSLETGLVGLLGKADARGRSVAQTPPEGGDFDDDALEEALRTPTERRILDVDAALERGWPVEKVARLTGYDPWFCDQLLQICELRANLRACGGLDNLDDQLLHKAKRAGFSDAAIAETLGVGEQAIRDRRKSMGPVFKAVDTCAAEFAADTPYYYSTYEDETEIAPSGRPTIVILGSGPNRIGQGIEFDYACVHAVFALREVGFDTVMVNCNPETVSTDYDTADRLYFEPLTLEDVLAVCEAEQPQGVLVQLGGQTPLKLARALDAAGVPILGTPPSAIDLAEDRGRFAKVLDDLGIDQPPGGVARSLEQALEIAARIGFPVLVRPSYVLGGQAMEIVYTPQQMATWLARNAGEGQESGGNPKYQVLVDKFLEGAVEVDVDAIYDGTELFVGGVMEHIEEAGVHSGDSACVVPPYTLGRAQLRQLRCYTEEIARALKTRGLINIQFAIRNDEIFVLEANPRASRTVPFISKATGVPLAKIAALVMTGTSLANLRERGLLPAHDSVTGPALSHVAVKEAVLPFNRFPGVDTRLGPEMRSTGEVMGIDPNFGVAFAKSQVGTGAMVLPTKGTVFCSIASRDKRAMIFPVKRLAELGFEVLATEGTAETLRRAGVQAVVVRKFSEGSPNVVDRILAGKVDLVLNTPKGGGGPRVDGYEIRSAAVSNGIPCITTLSGILAAVQGIEALRANTVGVRSLQSYHGAARLGPGSPKA